MCRAVPWAGYPTPSNRRKRTFEENGNIPATIGSPKSCGPNKRGVLRRIRNPRGVSIPRRAQSVPRMRSHREVESEFGPRVRKASRTGDDALSYPHLEKTAEGESG